MKKLLIFILTGMLNAVLPAMAHDCIDLSGIWRFQLDPMGFGKTPGSEHYLNKLAETIMLPGSTDEGGKGIRNTFSHVDRLSRKFEYCGAAWYQREVEIPTEWADKEIILILERCHWETTVYVDGQYVAAEERLSAPNRFVLTKELTPGVHILTLCIDNRLKYPMDQWNHGTTEYTQTNWNGVVGRICLQAKNKSFIRNLQIFPDAERKEVTAKIFLHKVKVPVKGELSLAIHGQQDEQMAFAHFSVELPEGSEYIEKSVPVKGNIRMWDEFTPSLYCLEASWHTDFGKDSVSQTFGFRKVEQGKLHIHLNGQAIHLRGVLDCAVFPRTGYPAMEKESWMKIFRTVKQYGMNHVRFHSWCPPESAFCAADELGIYVQAELPMWIKNVGKYPARRDFFEAEMYAILNEYGNHPSFILMCNGNENEGNFEVLEDLVKKARKFDNRRLYSASTARTHVKSDQFYVSHVTDKGRITVYEGKPSTDWDCNNESDIDVPVIAHETGQRCMYPNFKEIKKYTGVLEPRNFHVFQERLARHGMLHQAEDFFRATGLHTVLQYKEVNEALLRSSKSGGFQLLGLSDFPGQGSAFVGILDAFWEDKGLVSPEKFRESCAPAVILARFSKRVYTDKETFSVKMGIYNYSGKSFSGGNMRWSLIDEQGKEISQGKLRHGKVERSTVDSLGRVNVPLNQIHTAGKYTFHAWIDELHNEWDIWVYPEIPEDLPEGVQTHSWLEAKKLLAEGKHVLFVPDTVEGRKTRFAGHFWNPIMFNWAPMIVGTLIDASHPALAHFPTSYYADWQWWDILNYGTAVDLTNVTGLTPVIQSVDTYEENKKLGIAFEAKVGKGRLFVLCVDIEKQMAQRLATKQLFYSIQKYVASEKFAPEIEVPVWLFDAVFSKMPRQKEKVRSAAAIEQLLNK
ncbi:sugar-binding domain-containing protein [Phocaeicola plebeius]|uniref:sugar-binding domain-containing protein n=1 Tax=Phocaeicola plebeius TaxID=310297 RepID=UPI0026F2C7E7|nr:sugar-binding domain-containing protein [Phocaeicola plebeius]